MTRAKHGPPSTSLSVTAAIVGLALSIAAGAGIAARARKPADAPAVPYPREPKLIASDHSMGVALADINGDGFLDIVVANGSDVEKSHLVVFHGDHGQFRKEPDWVSDDRDFNAGVALGDVDQDGFVDVAVTVGPAPGTDQAGGVKVYSNHGGKLDKVGTFIDHATENYKSIGCAFGDVDGDGLLDLAVAVAEEKKPGVAGPLRVYANRGGKLTAPPVWRSEPQATLGVKFADVDGDGLLDLIAATPGIPVYPGGIDAQGKVHLGHKATLLAHDKIQYPISTDVGRVGGTLAVAVAYDDYFADTPGTGARGVPRPRGLAPAGRRETATAASAAAAAESCAPTSASSTHSTLYAVPAQPRPIWTSKDPGWGFGVLLLDVDGDGHLDLVSSAFGPGPKEPMRAPLRIYTTSGATPSREPTWSSATCSGQQFMAAGDLSGKSGHPSVERFRIARQQAVLTLGAQIVDRIDRVSRNGARVDRSEYATVPGANWVSFKKRLMPGDAIEVRYVHPTAVDIVVTNMNTSNMIFYHQPAR